MLDVCERNNIKDVNFRPKYPLKPLYNFIRKPSKRVFKILISQGGTISQRVEECNDVRFLGFGEIQRI